MKVGRLLLPILIIAILTTTSFALTTRDTPQCSNLYADRTPQGEFVDWSDSYNFTKFDPSKGTLTGIEFNATLNGSLFAEAENRARTPVNGAYVNVLANLTVQMIEGEKLNLLVPITTGLHNVTAFDGVLDFKGTSAFNASAEGNTNGTITNVSNLSAYVGSGNITLPAVCIASSTVGGGGTWASNITTLAWSYACITYIYDNTHCLSGYKKNGCTNESLANWAINVSNDTWFNVTTTDSNGFWEVCDLEDGNYTICEVPQPGWTQTDPVGCYSKILAGANITNINFTNQELVCINGTKYDNCTGLGLANW
ncbi:MAG TPA: choice-of-anchor E domain-containing protein, partial [Methanothrix sp.]|nr:choice-of-anchor E domain-containing protein [Methanothrix sp.]